MSEQVDIPKPTLLMTAIQPFVYCWFLTLFGSQEDKLEMVTSYLTSIQVRLAAVYAFLPLVYQIRYLHETLSTEESENRKEADS